MQNLRLRGRPPPIFFARIARPMNALQLCSWQFSQKGIYEALRAKIDRQSAITLQRRQFNPRNQVEGDVPHQ